MAQPTVAVVIPVFNGEKCLREAILSALAQTYAPNEIIVVNDGSTDGTRSIVESFGNRVVCIDQINQGAAAARNAGTKAATSNWIAFLDADDYWLPEKLEKQIAALERRPTADLVYSGFTMTYVDGSLVEMRAEPFERTRKILPFEDPIATSSILARRSLLAANPWPTDLRSSEDWYLLHRLSRCAELICVEESGVIFRIHHESVTHHEWRKVWAYARLAAARIQSEYHGLDRMILHLRVEARLYANAAIAAREQDGRGFLPLISQSLLHWPFPDVRPDRYKLFLKMFMQSLSGQRPE